MSTDFSGKRIAFVLPPVEVGSGGIQTICRHIAYLQGLGAECSIHLVDGGGGRSKAELRRMLCSAYQLETIDLTLGCDYHGDYDAVIATQYTTVEHALLFGCPLKLYFVQDFEPLFFPAGDEYLRALSTYARGLRPITIGNWLASKLHDDFGVQADVTPFCADPSLYRPLALTREDAVCAIYQPGKPRRCGRLLLDALALVKQMRPQTRVYLYGAEPRQNLPFAAEQVGILSKEGCNELYNRCAVGVCMSSSNPSRIPFEMMAAGLPVVDLDLPNNKLDFAPGAVLLARPDVASVATAVLSLLDDSGARGQMGKAGMAFMASRPIVRETEAFSEALARALAGKEPLGAQVATLGENVASCVASAEIEATVTRLVCDRDALEAARRAPINAQWVRITVSGVPQDLVFDEARAYVWPVDHQSMQKNYLLERDDEGNLVATFDMNDFQGVPTRMNVHVYLNISGDNHAIAVTEHLIEVPGREEVVADDGVESVASSAPSVEATIRLSAAESPDGSMPAETSEQMPPAEAQPAKPVVGAPSPPVLKGLFKRLVGR